MEKHGVDKAGSWWCGVENSMEECGESDDGGGGAKEGAEGDDLAYKSVGRDPYLNTDWE